MNFWGHIQTTTLPKHISLSRAYYCSYVTEDKQDLERLENSPELAPWLGMKRVLSQPPASPITLPSEIITHSFTHSFIQPTNCSNRHRCKPCLSIADLPTAGTSAIRPSLISVAKSLARDAIPSNSIAPVRKHTLLYNNPLCSGSPMSTLQGKWGLPKNPLPARTPFLLTPSGTHSETALRHQRRPSPLSPDRLSLATTSQGHVSFAKEDI